MSTAEVLEKALEFLGPDGEFWIKGHFYAGMHKCCPLGAIGLARNKFHSSTGANPVDYLKLAIGKEAALGIIRWNDAIERTWPEVQHAFLAAIELAKQSEARAPQEI